MSLMQKQTLAKLMVAYSGLAWGLFWIPLRTLENAGIDRIWAIVIFNGLPFALALPFIIARWRRLMNGGSTFWLLAITMGSTQVLYSLSLLNTNIVDAIVLFYLNPIWAMLLARIFLGERLTVIRWLAIAIAFIGMAVVLNTGFLLPFPRNIGDWLAVAGGVAWACSIILLKVQKGAEPLDLSLQNFIGTALLLIPFMFLVEWTAVPALSLFANQLWWLIPFIVLVFMTGVYASMWAVPLLPPAIVGLLYMTEISSGAISAALLSGEAFGWRQAAGITLITLAGSFESINDLWKEKRPRQA
jgi:drug/metabolite transporter (DMT)-like permease